MTTPSLSLLTFPSNLGLTVPKSTIRFSYGDIQTPLLGDKRPQVLRLSPDGVCTRLRLFSLDTMGVGGWTGMKTDKI